MNKFSLKACAFMLLTLVVLASIFSVQAMDGQGDAQEGSSFFKKLAFVTLVPTAGFVYLLRKHYNELHALERQLDISTIAQSARETNFRFATWRSRVDNASEEHVWGDAEAVRFDSEQVVATLCHDAKNCPDRVYVYDLHGTRLEPNIVKKEHLKLAIAREKQLFEEQLATVAQFTNVPDLIVKECASADDRCLTSHELALTCASKLDSAKLPTIETTFRDAGTLKEILYFGGWLPTSWSVAPCYQKASRVYLKLFKAYARLCALDAAINAEK